MAFIYRPIMNEFLKHEGKIFKTIKTIEGETFYNVIADTNPTDDKEIDIVIVNGDLRNSKYILKIVHPSSIEMMELYKDDDEIIDTLATFNLKPLSHFLRFIVAQLATKQGRQEIDRTIGKLIDRKTIKRLCVALWLIDDPDVRERFAR